MVKNVIIRGTEEERDRDNAQDVDLADTINELPDVIDRLERIHLDRKYRDLGGVR